MRPSRAAVALVLTASACSSNEPRSWEQHDGGTMPKPLFTAPSVESAVAPASSSAAARVDPDEPALPVRVGGGWVRCYGHFKPSNEPLRDVTRLGLACGPSNGMRRLAAPVEGSVDVGGKPANSRFPVKRGACYRVFAVAEKTVGELELVLRSGRGTPIGEARGPDVWPIVDPDRPICALEDDTWTAELTGHGAKGRFALEVWWLSASAH